MSQGKKALLALPMENNYLKRRPLARRTPAFYPCKSAGFVVSVWCDMSSDSPASSIFPRTDWAGLGEAAEADEARLDQLIRLYWAPLRIFLVATFPSLKDQADMLLQEFAEDKILKEGWLRRADRDAGEIPRFSQNQPAPFCSGPLESGRSPACAGFAG